MSPSTNEVLRLLRASGGRVTVPRRAVVEVLVEATGEHLTAEDLVARVRRRNPDIHRATVYRALEKLQEAGLVAHVHFGHGPSAFHLGDHPHHHAVCRSCGATVELSLDYLDDLSQRLRKDHGWELAYQHFALSARCPTCLSAQRDQEWGTAQG